MSAVPFSVLTPVAVSVMAHPDDAEFLVAGSLAILARQGWSIHLATLSAGEMGSMRDPPAATAARRRREAHHAAQVLGGAAHCLDMPDLGLYYHPDAVEKTALLLRRLTPAVVMTHPPRDYHTDHEETSRIVRAACFAAAVPHYGAGMAAPLPRVPHLYYADAFDGRDALGREVAADFAVDVRSVWELKERALLCHESQIEWLREHHHEPDPLVLMRRRARERGAAVNLELVEVFSQHQGRGFPTDNLLAQLL